ncbi:conserved hypothetical protein [Ferroglobus placidus DSM 10642]|uniref:Nucleoside recognition domain protein n=1 Tax=Ferroglobus placidus (strain DSM 10642 / AEDII12DO) TaxID=589924 RepID=D3S1U8_FERPA|nr:conserved hypothetical protein [Ferroglobus placidus DSM 10642]
MIGEAVLVLQTILPRIFLGILAGSLIISSPIFRHITKYSVKFFKIRSSAAVAAFFADKAVGLSVLAEMYKKGVINEKEVVIASVLGLLPLSIRSTFLTLAPVSISTLGFKLGVSFLTIELLSKFIIAGIAYSFGRKITMSTETIMDYRNEQPVFSSLLFALKTFFRVSLIISLTVLLTAFLINSDNFTPIDERSMLILAGAGSTLAGFGVAGSLLSEGKLNEEVVLILLFVALALHRAVEAVRYTVPLNISLFGYKTGARVAALTFLANEISCIIGLVLAHVFVALRIIWGQHLYDI